MKTVAFITVHVGNNFGSNLQAIATAEVLKKVGADPILINYIPPRVTLGRYLSEACQSVGKLIWRVVFFPFYIYEKSLYKRFLAKRCKMSDSIYATDSFSNSIPKADIYMTGSDQVWNFKWNEGIDEHYFFTGIQGIKISFASSMGLDNLNEEQSSFIRKSLTEYKALSVRESHAQIMLKDLGFQSEHVIDPTLMLDRTEWEKYMSKRLIREKYVFVYIPYNIKDKDAITRKVREIANKGKLKVVAVTSSIFKEPIADKTIRFATPGDFLSLIYHASFVVTNSFHGTAFSINLNKQFCVFMPAGFTTRITSLLELCGLSDRIADNGMGPKENERIDYQKVNSVLQRERLKAFEYLRKAIS